MSTKKFDPTYFRDMTLENQSERTVNGSSSYFLAANISRNEMNSSKVFQFKEGIEKVDGFNVNLKTIGIYYLYVRATITDKVFFFLKILSLVNCFSRNGTKSAVFLLLFYETLTEK